MQLFYAKETLHSFQWPLGGNWLKVEEIWETPLHFLILWPRGGGEIPNEFIVLQKSYSTQHDVHFVTDWLV